MISGSGIARHPEDLEQRGVPLRRAELRARRGRGVGREAGAQAVAEERVDGAHPSGAGLDRVGDVVVVLKQPGELAGREVWVEGHPASLPDLVGPTLGFEPVEDLLGALVLPGDDRGQRARPLSASHASTDSPW